MIAQVQTAGGHYVNPLFPEDFTPRIEDIAHQLSMQCRFAGATCVHYSVAEHSCRVADICSPANKLWALLHDGPEYLLLDLPRPLKHHPFFGAAYRSAELALMSRICDVFGLPQTEPDEVRRADSRLAVTERRDLLPHDPDWQSRSGWLAYALVRPLESRIEPWGQERARDEFLSRYETLTRKAAA